MDFLAKNCHRKTVERFRFTATPGPTVSPVQGRERQPPRIETGVLSIRFAKRLLQLRAEGSLVLCRHLQDEMQGKTVPLHGGRKGIYPRHDSRRRGVRVPYVPRTFLMSVSAMALIEFRRASRKQMVEGRPGTSESSRRMGKIYSRFCESARD
jgi:hypothetical protein